MYKRQDEERILIVFRPSGSSECIPLWNHGLWNTTENHCYIQMCKLTHYRANRYDMNRLLRNCCLCCAQVNLRWTEAEYKTVFWPDKLHFQISYGCCVLQPKEERDHLTYYQYHISSTGAYGWDVCFVLFSIIFIENKCILYLYLFWTVSRLLLEMDLFQ